MSRPVGPVDDQLSVVSKSGPPPVNVSEYERHAHSVLPRNAYGYYGSGANDMITLRENRSAYSRLYLLPRILKDVSHIDTSTTVLGTKISFPVCVAPTAMQCMAHPLGEAATARAASRSSVLMGLSSLSTTSIEDVAAAAPAGQHWFQLYVYKDRAVTLSLIRRAEAAGFKAVAITVDTPVLGRREAIIRNKFTLPNHLTLGNFVNRASTAHASGVSDMDTDGSKLMSYFSNLVDPGITWEDIAWVRKNTTMKIVVKGVMTVDDAIASVRHGVDGIWVSNHGARQLDTTPATIEVLPDICKAVAGRVEVYIDGGIVRGTDVCKALALGARAVFVGRPVIWGLAHDGEDGVHRVLQLLREEFTLAMKLLGCLSVKEINASHVRHVRSYRTSKI